MKRISLTLAVVFSSLPLGCNNSPATLPATAASPSNSAEPIRPKHDVATIIFGGEENFATVRDATTVTAQRMHGDFKDGGLYRLQHYEFGPAVTVNKEIARELQDHFSNESTYVWNFGHSCEPEYGVLLTFQADDRVVRLAICFQCTLFSVFEGNDNEADYVNKNDQIQVEEELIQMIKAVFPADPEIQALLPHPHMPTEEEQAAMKQD